MNVWIFQGPFLYLGIQSYDINLPEDLEFGLFTEIFVSPSWRKRSET